MVLKGLQCWGTLPVWMRFVFPRACLLLLYFRLFVSSPEDLTVVVAVGMVAVAVTTKTKTKTRIRGLAWSACT